MVSDGHWQYETLVSLFTKQIPPFKQGFVEQDINFSSQYIPLVPLGHIQLAEHLVDEQFIVDETHCPPFWHGDDTQSLTTRKTRKL